MNENEHLASIICEHLTAATPVVLVSIVESRGSSPRHSGTRMVVGANGKSYGTIGGGLLEAQSLAEAGKALNEGRSSLAEFNFTGNANSTDEMLCGGTARLLFDLVLPTRENLAFFESYRSAAANGESFYALTTLEIDGDKTGVTGRSLCLRNGTLVGSPPLSEEGLETLKTELRQLSTTGILSLEGLNIVADPLRRTRTVYLFGGGHVAQPTAHMSALVGFRVVVVDDRAEFASAERFPDASEIIVPGDFARAMDRLNIDEDSYVVIMTRGHRHDRAVLEQALKSKAGYIGMMGSLRKRQITYSELLKHGFSQAQLDAVHCPIGLPIRAETPEEIAVSVVAELVQVRAGQPQTSPSKAEK